MTTPFQLECPLPIRDHPRVLLAHGGGGRLMRELIASLFATAFANPSLEVHHDAAVLAGTGHRFAFTTDSYVVRPLFFPGGDLGSLAVHGTVNDLAMSGARPLYLSAAFILEEGLEMETLWRIAGSMRRAADAAGVRIVTGDTKVVDRGKGDGVFVNTTGIGVLEHGLEIHPRSVRAGDVIVVSGDVGRHGMAVMAVREGLEFESAIESDSASVAAPVLDLVQAGVGIRCLRDLTRGGLTAALNEIADSAGLGLRIDEAAVPVREDVRAACELLGLDPFQVACEGRFVAFVPAAEVARTLAILRAPPEGRDAREIGVVTSDPGARVLLRSVLGAHRILSLPAGEQLPRIC